MLLKLLVKIICVYCAFLGHIMTTNIEIQGLPKRVSGPEVSFVVPILLCENLTEKDWKLDFVTANSSQNQTISGM